MPKRFTFKFNTVEPIRRLPGSWSPGAYRRVLEVLDIDASASLPEADLEDLALMALQDREPEEAMQVILEHFTEGRFTRGQIQNLCEELKEDRSWEEYSDIADQKALYLCVDLLNAAFPFEYPTPSATQVKLEIKARDLDKTLAQQPLDPATLLRGIGLCQEKDNILNRFFADQIAGAAFPEADWILWHKETQSAGPDTLEIIFYGSSYWFEDLEEEVEVACTLEWPED